MAGCFSKFFLFVLNFAIFGVGVAVITLASMILAHSGDFQKLMDTGVFTLPIIFLLIGVAVMLLGFFGCFGALRESPCLLYTYATIVLILFCSQVALVVYGLVEEDEIREFIENSMKKTMDKYGATDDPTLNDSIDAGQHSLKCCGVHNYTDWYSGFIQPGVSPDVAKGCCKDLDQQNCYANIASLSFDQAKEKIYTQGCYTLFMNTVESEALWLIIGGSVLALVQLACITIACGLGRKASSSATY